MTETLRVKDLSGTLSSLMAWADVVEARTGIRDPYLDRLIARWVAAGVSEDFADGDKPMLLIPKDAPSITVTEGLLRRLTGEPLPAGRYVRVEGEQP